MFAQSILFEFSPSLLVALLFGYLLGSIPFGLIITKFAGAGDVRAIGSGNIGATNVLRTGRKGLAAATLIADMLKGAAAVLIANYILSPDLGGFAGFGAFLGHCFPIWLKFKGGKGVATYVGVLAALSFKAVLVFAVVWLSCAAITRFSSLSALVASIVATLSLYYFGLPSAGHLFVLMTLLVWMFHRANISRLLSGSEGKIGQKG